MSNLEWIALVVLAATVLMLLWTGLPKLTYGWLNDIPQPDFEVTFRERAGAIALSGVLTGLFIFLSNSPWVVFDRDIVGLKLSVWLAVVFGFVGAVLFACRLKWPKGAKWLTGDNREIKLSPWALTLIGFTVGAWILLLIAR